MGRLAEPSFAVRRAGGPPHGEFSDSLLLSGRRLLFNKPLPAADYYYSIARAQQRPDCQVYHWTLRQPLPTLPVPLRQPDGDLQIDLGAVFATVYGRAKFFRRVDYRGSVPEFVSGMDRQWVEEVVSKLPNH
ncbi:MAG TPA: DUF4058 family protein [Pirellulales bacterium]